MMYLDNAATTKPSQAALDGMRAAEAYFANPSSTHFAGLSVAKWDFAAWRTAWAQIA